MANKISKNIAIAAGIVGFLLLFCGLGACITGFIWLGYGGKGAHGIWSGIFLLACGSLGVVILITKNRAVMVFFLVFCIIDLIINAIQAIIAAIVAALLGLLKDALDKGNCTELKGKCHCNAGDANNAGFEFEGCDDINAMIRIFNAITAFAVLGIITTFTGSIIGCIGACCDKSGDQPGVVVIQQGNQQPGTVTTVHSVQQHENPAYPHNPSYPAPPVAYPAPAAAYPSPA